MYSVCFGTFVNSDSKAIQALCLLLSEYHIAVLFGMLSARLLCDIGLHWHIFKNTTARNSAYQCTAFRMLPLDGSGQTALLTVVVDCKLAGARLRQEQEVQFVTCLVSHMGIL